MKARLRTDFAGTVAEAAVSVLFHSQDGLSRSRRTMSSFCWSERKLPSLCKQSWPPRRVILGVGPRAATCRHSVTCLFLRVKEQEGMLVLPLNRPQE